MKKKKKKNRLSYLYICDHLKDGLEMTGNLSIQAVSVADNLTVIWTEDGLILGATAYNVGSPAYNYRLLVGHLNPWLHWLEELGVFDTSENVCYIYALIMWLSYTGMD
jgi:hypothetical protein